ncbi:hypothetical protein Lalb_Chr08g0236301 [Lupinus albus]|uniref:RNA-directed DNA polymerase n=1 Tax=Lupinus albus TaxID=3870 RepID=A0A6A4Q3Q0_LUPAL|nr:hypothetical protein Lalb_Chr08g0236301 [Lupinus albus]
MKNILKCFELISGLKVNFIKSSLIGIRVTDVFLADSTSFLSCKIASMLFLYLGILVGANLSSYSTWYTIIEKVAKRLALCK